MEKGKRRIGKYGLRRIMGYRRGEREQDLFTKVRKDADSDSELSSVAEGGVERWWWWWWCLCLLGFRL